MLFQQGDVLLQKVEIDLSDAKKEPLKNNTWVVAEGEHTGHAHVIVESEAIVYHKNGKRYVLTEKGFTITHEEHNPITVQPGVYEVGIVQEYDHFIEETKNVED